MPSETEAPIYTIGYGSRSIDEFLDALRARQIEYLVDIRSAPYSRFKPEFSQSPLESFLRGHGVRYIYMGDTLGGKPADRDCYVDDKVVYERVESKKFYQDGLARLAKAYRQGLRVAIMCSEGKPEACHRSKLIGASLVKLGIAVAHIDETGALRSQEDVILGLTHGQLSLFGDPSFTSRKRYRAKETKLEEEGDDA